MPEVRLFEDDRNVGLGQIQGEDNKIVTKSEPMMEDKSLSLYNESFDLQPLDENAVINKVPETVNIVKDAGS